MHTKDTAKKWHAIYTRSRAEKKVLQSLTLAGVECFLPLQKKLHQWKDRKKWVESPLIPGYCFVRISRKEYDLVLQDSNVVCYITFEGRAATIPDFQIDQIKILLKQYEFEVTVSFENFEKGQSVEIIRGPLIGLKGTLLDVRGKHKFMIQIEQINTVFTVEVEAEYLTNCPVEA